MKKERIYWIRATKGNEIRDFYVVETACTDCNESLLNAGYKTDVNRWE